MQTMSKIITLKEQQHFLSTLPEIFDTLTISEITAIADRLGLAEIIQDGQLVPMYSVQIKTSSERVLDMENFSPFSLSGDLYNYFSIVQASNYDWKRNSGNTAEDNAWNRKTKSVSISAADLTERIYERDITFTLSVTVNEETYTDTITFGVTGTFNKVQIEADNTIFVGEMPAQINFTSRLYGTVPKSYRWYVDDVLVASTNNYSLRSSAVEVGKSAKVSVEVTDPKGNIHTDYLTIPKISNGNKGEPGVPGPAGADGKTLYTHIKYADDESGTNMSEYPSSLGGMLKEYIGMATNQTTPIESNNPEDYVWSRYIGPEGIPGENGYMWIKYSQFSNGRDLNNVVSMHDDGYDENADEYMVYMGIAYNKQSKLESMIPEDYIWSKIRGDDGHTGYTLDLTNENQMIPTDSDGKILGPEALVGATTDIQLFYGDTIVPTSQWTMTTTKTHDGITFRIDTLTEHRQLVLTGYDTPNLTDYIEVSVALPEGVKRLRFTITKAKNEAAYSLLPSVNTIKVSSAGVITPTTISCKVLKNNGRTIVETTEARVTWKYDYQTGDGTVLQHGTTMSPNTTGNPIYLQFLLYHPVTGLLIDKEDVPFMRDGLQGPAGADGKDGTNGTNGTNGKDGLPGAPGIAGALVIQHEWVSGTTYYNNQNRKDYVYHRATNIWYKIKDGITSAVAGGTPDNNWVVASEVKGSVIAEKMNVGGWIVSNNKLFSQAGLVLDGSGNPIYSNIILNAITGQISMGNNRAILDQTGLGVKDSNGKERMAFKWDDGTGVPILRTYNADGSILWEAGKDGYRVIVTGTRPTSWTKRLFRKIAHITNNPNATVLDVNSDSYDASTGAIDNTMALYMTNYAYNATAFPVTSTGLANYNTTLESNGNVGVVWDFYKGDISSNATYYEATYLNQSAIRTTDVMSSPPLLANGWYISGVQGDGIMAHFKWDQNTGAEYQVYCITAYYYVNGNIFKTVDVPVKVEGLGGSGGGPVGLG